MGKYTNIDILLGSHLSPRAVQTKLTPRLGSFVGVIEDELNFAMDNDFPPCKGASPALPCCILKKFLRKLSQMNG